MWLLVMVPIFQMLGFLWLLVMVPIFQVHGFRKNVGLQSGGGQQLLQPEGGLQLLLLLLRLFSISIMWMICMCAAETRVTLHETASLQVQAKLFNNMLLHWSLVC